MIRPWYLLCVLGKLKGLFGGASSSDDSTEEPDTSSTESSSSAAPSVTAAAEKKLTASTNTIPLELTFTYATSMMSGGQKLISKDKYVTFHIG